MSLQVVINGPVAMAGSIPFLCRNNGINVPIIPATIMTATNDNEMAKAVPRSCFQTQTNTNKNKAKIMPFKAAKNISFISRLLTLPLTSSLAKPCTIIAED